MAAPIHHHHHVHHHVPVDTTQTEAKVVRLRDPDSARDVLESSTSNKGSGNALLDSLLGGDRITVGAFTDAVEIPKEKSKQKLYDNDRLFNDTAKKLNAAKMDNANNLATILANINSVFTAWNAVKSTEQTEIDGINSTVTAYNDQILPADQDAIDALNDGTDQYNNGDIDLATYQNNYVTPYNNYVASRNAAISASISDYSNTLNTFNTVDVPANNATIDGINTASAQYNIAPITPELTVPPQSTFLLPTADPNPVGTATHLSDPRTELNPATGSIPEPSNQADFLETYYDPIFNAAAAALKISQTQLQMLISQVDFIRFNLRDVDPTKQINLPNSVTVLQSRMANDTTSGSFNAGGGVATAIIASGLGSPHMESNFSQSIFEANSTIFQLQFSNGLGDKLKTFGNLSLFTTGIQSLKPAVAGLNVNTLAPNLLLNAFNVTLGVNVASTVLGLILSGATEDAVRSFVEQDLKGKADQKTIDRATRILTAELNIAFLQFAATTAAIALQAPGLPAQLTANITGLPANVASTPLSPDRVLADSQRTSFLTTALTGTLSTDNGIGRNQAQTFVTTALNAAITSGIKNSDELNNALLQSFISQGLTNEEATRLAGQAVAIVQQESTATRDLHTPLLDQTFSVNLLIPLLVQQGNLSNDRARTVANQAIQEVIKNQAVTSDIEFQIALQQQLEQAGISGSTAKLAATSLVNSAVATASTEPSPLSVPTPDHPLNGRQLRNALARHSTSLLANPLGQGVALQHGHRIVEVLIGAPGSSTSLLAQLNTNVGILQRESGNRAGGVLLPSFREFLSPNLDAFVFNRKVLDPANTFLLTAIGSTRMTDVLHQPKDYIKYLDFYV
ncbi:MAG: hypothetical protein LLG04_16955 [Parachlamydia sp.]|nr:hypothetical protein [Parachlamydia sp.]